MGNFTADPLKRDAVLCHDGSRDEWIIGTWDGTRLVWQSAGKGGMELFQHAWVGKFSQGFYDELLFYVAFDGTWRLGVWKGGALTWRTVGNTGPRPLLSLTADPRSFLAGNFNDDKQQRDGILQFDPATGDWTLGTWNGTGFGWRVVANTATTFTGLFSTGSRFWTAGGNQVIAFDPNLGGEWYVAEGNAARLTWRRIGSSASFGSLADGRPIFIDDFIG